MSRVLRFGTAAAVALIAAGAVWLAGNSSPSGRPRPRVASATAGHVTPRMDCSSLARDPRFLAVPQYPTTVSSASVVAARGSDPSYCDLKGTIAPQTQFELELPVSTWQGRYLQNGCGGYCGVIHAQSFPACDGTLGGDFAMATDDEGHTASSGLGGTGLFASNSQTLRVEFGYESEHALAVVAKAMITAYYGRGPTYSYFSGCSDGGREAMELAERYPDDFNGILAGAPEIVMGPLNAELQTWDYRVNTDSRGDAILTSDKLPALHGAVMAACGGDDGAADGIITDPRDCDFNPARIQCPPGKDNPGCLTAAQVQVVRELYQGPVDPQGHHLYPGGLEYGSELSWPGFEVSLTPDGGGSVPSTETVAYTGLSLPYLRFALRGPGHPGSDPSRWSFTDRSFYSLFPVANTYDAMDTDLSAFRRHGGKLLIWQGWADQAIPTYGTIDYYDTLAGRMGGSDATRQFARMFLFPTVAHCGGGYGASGFEVLLPLVRWVESGVAPSKVIATDRVGGSTVTRPVYPYPLVPMYDGHGNPDSEASFHPVTSAHAGEYSHWIGDYLFHQPATG